MKLDSPNALHWLMTLVFPELQVRVEKATLKRQVVLKAPILGKFHLGHQTVFGKKKILPMAGKLITLFSDEEETAIDQPWAQEINQRLQKFIFLLLQHVGVNLEIWLVIRSQGNALSLNPSSYLGYENIHSDTKHQFRRIRIYSGYLSD